MWDKLENRHSGPIRLVAGRDGACRGHRELTCSRGQLEGGLGVVVLTSVHSRALHVGTSIQEQLQGAQERQGVGKRAIQKDKTARAAC